MKRMGVILTVLVIALALGAAVDAGPRVKDYCLEPGETAVRLRAADGTAIYGVEVGRGTRGVVFGHQFLSDHCEWMEVARELAADGYRALSIDFRSNGFSGRAKSARMDLDIAAAVARLRKDGVEHVTVVGSSMGATAVLVAAARIKPAVDGVVSLSAPARYAGLDAERAVATSRVPVRFLADTKDGAYASDARRLYRASAAEDKALRLSAKGLHGQQLLALKPVKAYVDAFLRRR